MFQKLPQPEGSRPTPHFAPLSKEDVADLLDEHYLRITQHIETCLEGLKLSHIPLVSGSAEGRASKIRFSTGQDQGTEVVYTSELIEQPALQDSPSDHDELDRLQEEVPCERTPCRQEDSSECDLPVEIGAQELHVTIGQVSTSMESAEDDEVQDETDEDWVVKMSTERASAQDQIQSHRSTMMLNLVAEIAEVRRWSASHFTWMGTGVLMNILNAVLVGVRIEYERGATDSDTVIHMVLNICASVLCVFFVCELFHRFLTQKLEFFTGSECAWNALEILISLCMIADEIFRRSSANFAERLSISWLSALRIIVLLKHHSVLKSMPFWCKLHAFVCVLKRCCIAVIWPVVIILLLTYLLALALTQRTTEFCVSDSLSNDLCKYFGGLEASIFSLLAAVLGGLPWGVLYDEFRNLGVFYTMMFVLFVAMMSLVLLNTLLSAVIIIYQQLAGSNIDDDIAMQMRRHREYVEKAMHVFEICDSDFNGNVSIEEFRYASKDERMVALLDSMQVQIFDADEIFKLLDFGCTGCMDVNELIEGLLRIRGTARGVDLVKLGNQFDSMNRTLENLCQSLQSEDIATRDISARLTRAPAPSSNRASGVSVWSEISHGLHDEFASLRKLVMSDLQKGNPDSRSRIAHVEHRAMTLKELRAVFQTVTLLCPDEKWVNTLTQASLLPAEVNLYTFTHYFLCPATLPSGVIFRDTVGLDVVLGFAVTQCDNEGIHQASGTIIEILGEGSFRLLVTTGKFTDRLPISIEGHPCVRFSMETPTHLSYKELVASTPLSPTWFCSHWWGERIFDFVSCIECHSKLHRYPEDQTGYWICAYANDQHDLGLDIGGEVENSSFYKAMAISTGVLVILDPAATAFTRIWCDFEIYKAITDEKELDVVTVRERNASKSSEPRPCILTQNCCPGETSRHKMQRELYFPRKILSCGMNVQLENGHASMQSDKDAILHIMTRGYSSASTDFHATLALAIQTANATLHSYFAQAAWPSAIKRKNVEDFDQERPGMLSLPSILVQDASRRCLALNFSYLEVLSDQDIILLAQGLPPQLETLDLDFNNCNRVTDTGVMHLAFSLKSKHSLYKIILNFGSCVRITDKGVLALVDCFPLNLRELHLHFLACKKISPLSAQAIAKSVLNSFVQSFSATFKGSFLDKDFDSLKDLKKWCRKEKITTRPSKWTPIESQSSGDRTPFGSVGSLFTS